MNMPSLCFAHCNFNPNLNLFETLLGRVITGAVKSYCQKNTGTGNFSVKPNNMQVNEIIQKFWAEYELGECQQRNLKM